MGGRKGQVRPLRRAGKSPADRAAVILTPDQMLGHQYSGDPAVIAACAAAFEAVWGHAIPHEDYQV